MKFWRSIKPHPAIVRPVVALALAVWVLVGSVVYLVSEQRDTQQRVSKIEAFERACLTSAPDTPRCDELYDSLVAGLSQEQLRELQRRLSSAAAAR